VCPVCRTTITREALDAARENNQDALEFLRNQQVEPEGAAPNANYVSEVEISDPQRRASQRRNSQRIA